MSRVYGVGLIGAGVIFEHHARAYEELASRVRLVGIADTDPNKLSKATMQFFVPLTCQDYHELLGREDVDIVAVCTPPRFHEEMVVAALEAGKYVICEKPLAHTLASADRILEAAERFPGKLTTVFQLRYLPEVQRMVWLRDEGRLGRLVFGVFTGYHRIKGDPSGESGWWGRWEVAGGGVVISQLIHQLDLMLHLFGPATEVRAVVDTYNPGVESEDTCAAVVRFASGGVASCSGTAAAQGYGFSFEVFGESGSVRYPWALHCADKRKEAYDLRDVMEVFPDPYRQSMTLTARALRKGLRKLHLGGKPRPTPSGHTRYIRAVLNAIDGEGALPIGPETARGSLELCMALYESALTGSAVRLPVARTSPYYGGITADDYRSSR